MYRKPKSSHIVYFDIKHHNLYLIDDMMEKYSVSMKLTWKSASQAKVKNILPNPNTYYKQTADCEGEFDFNLSSSPKLKKMCHRHNYASRISTPSANYPLYVLLNPSTHKSIYQ